MSFSTSIINHFNEKKNLSEYLEILNRIKLRKNENMKNGGNIDDEHTSHSMFLLVVPSHQPEGIQFRVHPWVHHARPLECGES